jgi:DMSO/TMAO reductase YedYZ molybdopterin-dependent catalytic subunit
MQQPHSPAGDRSDFTRRRFLRLGAAGVAALSVTRLGAGESAAQPHPALAEAVAKLEYLTPDEKFRFFGRGDPPPHKLPAEKRRAVGLAKETWQLEVLADPESKASLENPLAKDRGTALDWNGLMKLAEKHATRFMAVMTCTNGKFPCGMGLWEGVPLRHIVWAARPSVNVRRVFYYGYHNDDPEQRFQSSLTIGRVLEDPPGEHPVILCYKLNGQWLSPKAGAPVCMAVPGAYGNKWVKWLQTIMLTSSYQINDTYAQWNNDTESPLKTCARFIHVPEKVRAGQPAAVTGLAQVGMSGLSRVQYWLHPKAAPLPEDDPHLTAGDWRDATILPPPQNWGGGLPGGTLPPIPRQFDPATGRPRTWPLRDTIVHWAVLLRDIPPGTYDLRCRTIDAAGHAQPMPRPFPRSGHNAIQTKRLVVEA